MSDIFGRLKSGAGKVAFETEKMARVNRIQGEIGNIKRQTDSHYMRLGDLTYRSFVNNEPQSPEVPDICQSITSLSQQTAAKQEEIKRVNAEQFAAPPSTPAPTPAPQAAPSPQQGAKFCANCGKQNQGGVKFCPECGAKLD